jgi:hypothetical protein
MIGRRRSGVEVCCLCSSFRERETAHCNEQYVAVVARGLPAGKDGGRNLETVGMVTRVEIHMTRMEMKYLLRKRFKGQVLEMEKM